MLCPCKQRYLNETIRVRRIFFTHSFWDQILATYQNRCKFEQFQQFLNRSLLLQHNSRPGLAGGQKITGGTKNAR